MKKIESNKNDVADEEGEESERFIALEREYYYEKAKVDLITGVVKTVRDASKAAQAKLDEARLGGGIGSYDKRNIDKKLEKFASWNEEKQFDALVNFEEELYEAW